MGPITLFDKSFLQSLRIQEAVWFDQYSIANVCPMFYAETLADLSKSGRRGRTAAQEVRIIADKFPELEGTPCAYHLDLVYADLIGYSVPMTGQVPVAGGDLIDLDGQAAARVARSPVADAFSRWSKGEFFEVEKLHAKSWRDGLTKVDLDQAGQQLEAVGVHPGDCATLADASSAAKDFVTRLARSNRAMDEVLGWLGMPLEARLAINEAWAESPHATLSDFAPYAAFVIEIDAFFRLALASSLISGDRPSNRIDIAYMYYLPFCMVFVSSDKLHSKCAKFFLRTDQDFVWGQDLKAALKWVNEYFSALPEAEKLKGVMHLGRTLPPGGPSLLERIWDRHLPTWRSPETHHKAATESKDILTRIEKMKRSALLGGVTPSFDPTTITAATIERRIRRERGGWHQIPHDVP